MPHLALFPSLGHQFTESTSWALSLAETAASHPQATEMETLKQSSGFFQEMAVEGGTERPVALVGPEFPDSAPVYRAREGWDMGFLSCVKYLGYSWGYVFPTQASAPPQGSHT